MEHTAILKQVDAYYTGRLAEHGPVPRGVDWNSQASQELRFQELLRLCDARTPFSLLDYGCGYAALLDYLSMTRLRYTYHGYDVSAAMIAQAQALHQDKRACRFHDDLVAFDACDYVVASGIFNVKLQTPAAAWQEYVLDTIERLAVLSKKGFAFNILTSYSDPERRRSDLHYADPCFFFDHCKRKYSRHVSLLHDYDLYEFTILVRKPAPRAGERNTGS